MTILHRPVPSRGQLVLGAVYKRKDLHERFGGNRFSGIAPSRSEPVVLLFHTAEPAQQFYSDAFDDEGVYWYSGEGTSGDMSWSSANRAVREHAESGRDLLLFERAQRADGLWCFSHLMYCIDHRIEERRDKEGNKRQAIVFALMPIDTLVDGANIELSESEELLVGPVGLRGDEPPSMLQRMRKVYLRSAAVRQYALQRADGVCEACDAPAPFETSPGTPYLEVHHIDRLADCGPDRSDRVAAICPNCHCRCHYGTDGGEYNSALRVRIAGREQVVTAGRLNLKNI